MLFRSVRCFPVTITSTQQDAEEALKDIKATYTPYTITSEVKSICGNYPNPALYTAGHTQPKQRTPEQHIDKMESMAVDLIAAVQQMNKLAERIQNIQASYRKDIQYSCPTLNDTLLTDDSLLQRFANADKVLRGNYNFTL